MTEAVTESTIDVAYWFFQKAEKDKRFIDDKKIHLLLYFAQSRFMKIFRGSVLFPGLFVCDEDGLYEPNLAKILSFGRPFMPPVTFNEKTVAFLETVWNKFSAMPTADLEDLCKSETVYLKNFKPGEKHLISPEMIAENTDENGSPKSNKKKILFSQNGPVVVSQWNPRKL